MEQGAKVNNAYNGDLIDGLHKGNQRHIRARVVGLVVLRGNGKHLRPAPISPWISAVRTVRSPAEERRKD